MAKAGKPTVRFVTPFHMQYSGYATIAFGMLIWRLEIVGFFHFRTLNPAERNGSGENKIVGLPQQFLHMAGAAGA